MRLGPLDVTLPSLVYLALVVVLVVVNYRLYDSRIETRAQGYYNPTIRKALLGGKTQDLIDGETACQSVLKSAPGLPAANLYLGTFLYRQEKYADAQAAFEAAGESSKLSPAEQALAWSGAGASVFARYRTTQLEKAIEEAGKLFERALKADPKSPEAMVGKATILLWRETKKEPTEALALLDQALAPGRPPARSYAVAAYNARGVALSRTGRGAAADQSFEAAAAVDPDWPAPEQNRRLSAIGSLTLPDLELAKREALIQKYEKITQQFGEHEVLVLNALAVGLWRTRNDLKSREFTEKMYPQIGRQLQRAMSKFKTDPRAYLNQVGVYLWRLYGDAERPEEKGLVADLPADLVDPYNTLGASNLLIPPASSEGRRMLSPDEQKLVTEVLDLARQAAKVLDELLLRVKLPQEDRLNTEKLLVGMLELQQVCATLRDDRAKLNARLSERAQVLLEQGPNDAEALRISGAIELRQGRYGPALERLRAAQSKGDKSPELEKLLAQLGRPPEFVRTRPVKNRWYGARPLLGGAVHVPSNPGPLKLELLYDGKEQSQSVRWDTQILMLLDDGSMKDGTHEVKLTATDGAGNVGESAFKLYIDRRAPTGTLELEAGTALPRPVWKIVLADAGVGVDLNTVRITLKSLTPGATPLNLLLVQNGAYTKDLPAIQAKAGDRLAQETFKLSSTGDLLPGTYGVKVEFADLAGNERTLDKPFKLE